MNGTYKSILTVSALGVFRRGTVAVGNDSGDVHNIILGAGNDGGREIMTTTRNGCISVFWKHLLGAGS